MAELNGMSTTLSELQCTLLCGGPVTPTAVLSAFNIAAGMTPLQSLWTIAADV